MRIEPNRVNTTSATYSRFSAFLRFSPAVVPGAAPRLTAFTGLIVALELITGGTFDCAVPRGAGDTWRSFSFSPDVFVSEDNEDDTTRVFDADCCNGIVAVAIMTAPFCGEGIEGGDIDGKEAAHGSDAEMDCVVNSGGGT
jgi:hypothetical protein